MAAGKRWLFKSEPGDYSIADLERDGTTLWDGIRNYQVRNCMRDEMKPGQQFIFYHSSCKVPAAVGIGVIDGPAVPDPLQFKKSSKYYDPGSDPADPRWLAVPVRFVSRAGREYSLAAMHEEAKLEGFRLLQRGMRLSILPVAPAHWRTLTKAMQIA